MCFIQERCVLSYKFTMKFGIVLCKTPKKVSNTKFIDKLTLTHKKTFDLLWFHVIGVSTNYFSTLYLYFYYSFSSKIPFYLFYDYFFFLFVKRKQFTFKRPSEYLTLIKCILYFYTCCYIHAFWSMNKVAVNNSRKIQLKINTISLF